MYILAKKEGDSLFKDVEWDVRLIDIQFSALKQFLNLKTKSPYLKSKLTSLKDILNILSLEKIIHYPHVYVELPEMKCNYLKREIQIKVSTVINPIFYPKMKVSQFSIKCAFFQYLDSISAKAECRRA